MTNYYTGILKTVDVTIASGASLSGAIDLSGKEVALTGLRLCGLILPSGWDTAGVTFQASIDGTNYFNLHDKTAEYAVASTAASKFIALDPNVFASLPYIKIRSGTGASAVNQADAVTLTLVLRNVW